MLRWRDRCTVFVCQRLRRWFGGGIHEADRNHPDYPEFREQMTREAIAAIEGAQAAGATEVWVKDAHDSGRNLIPSMLPANIRLIRSWAGHPLCMVQELAADFGLPLAAVLEAIEYGRSKPPEVAVDMREEEALMQASGMLDPNYKYNPKPKILSLQEVARLRSQ